MDSDGWQTVCRRRTRVAPSRSKPQGLTSASPLSVYGGRPSYAQVLARLTTTTTAQPKKTAPFNNLPPPHPARPRQPTLITSPDSPTTLAFPLSISDPDWFNRCFKCFRKGHTTPKCPNPRRCAACWGENHDFRGCRKFNRRTYVVKRRPGDGVPPLKAPAHQKTQGTSTILAKTAQPQAILAQPQCTQAKEIRQPPRKLEEEADFLDLLTDPKASTVLPPDEKRPTSVTCFLSRDAVYFSEVASLSKALVITQPKDTPFELSLDYVAQMVADTGLVKADQLKMGTLNGGRFLISPPNEVSAFDICMAFKEDWWNEGYSAALWSPLLEAEIAIPRFKVWVRLVAPLPHLLREDFVIQAVGMFGNYLGTIVTNEPANLAAWDAAVAVPDMEKIPHRVSLSIGGLDYKVSMIIQQWLPCQAFTIADLPKLPPVVDRPSRRNFPSPSPSPEKESEEDDATVTLTVKDLRHIFRNVNPNEIPEHFSTILSKKPEADRRGKRPAEGTVTLLKKNFTPSQHDNGRKLITGGTSSSVVEHHLNAVNPVGQQDLVARQTPQKRLSNVDLEELRASVLPRAQDANNGSLLIEDDAAQVVSPLKNRGRPSNKRGTKVARREFQSRIQQEMDQAGKEQDIGPRQIHSDEEHCLQLDASSEDDFSE